MSRGKVKAYREHSAGSVSVSDAAEWNYLYESSTVRNSKFNIGDKVALPDDRVFRYGKAITAIADKNHALKFWSRMADNGVDYVTGVNVQAEVTGSDTLYITAAGKTLDELRGGYVIIHTHGLHNDQFRGILGSTETDADGKITIYLDAPLSIALLTTYGVEVHANPYSSLQVTSADNGIAGDRYSSVAGMASVLTTAVNHYLWVQTWGPCWVNPKGLVAAQTDRRGVWFDYEGSIIVANADVATESLQYAGYLMDREVVGGTGSPLVYLQISK